MERLLELRKAASKYFLCSEENVDQAVIGISSIVLILCAWVYLGY